MADNKEKKQGTWRSVAKGDTSTGKPVATTRPEPKSLPPQAPAPKERPTPVATSSKKDDVIDFGTSLPSQSGAIEFRGKNMEKGSFAGEDFEGANFSAANLAGADLSGANLRGVDFTSANLTQANLSGADLTGAVLTGAVLKETNFTGAILRKVKLQDADLQDAILLDIIIDDLTIGELQELIEFLAKHYPHKLNLSRINLTLLDLKKIDLKRVSLRGVDFSGVDFTGVNIIGLDLSECIITHAQIGQALGRVPSPEELKKILAPKPKEKGKGVDGIDFTKLFFDDGRAFGVWDATKDKGMSIETMLKLGKKIFRRPTSKPPVKADEILDKIKVKHHEEEKTNNNELRDLIEKRKQQELESRQSQKREAPTQEDKPKERHIEVPQNTRGGRSER